MSSEFSLEIVQEEILALLDQFPQPYYEVGVPDSDTLVRIDGQVDPYFAIQFGDIQATADHSMSDVYNDDYVMPIYIQAVAHDAKTARGLGNDLTRKLLGATLSYGGQIRKRPGMGMFTINASTGAVEAYQQPVSFGITVQLINL